MPVIYELRGKPATYTQLGLNLYSGCTVGCRYCSGLAASARRWRNGPTTRGRDRNILFGARGANAKKMQGDPRIADCPAPILINPTKPPG